MQRQNFLALAVAAAGLTAFHSPALAQEGTSPPGRVEADSERRMFDPVRRLLARRSELGLTDEQARRLGDIRTRYLQRNQPLIEQLRRSRAARDSARRADPKTRESRRALRASMDSVRTEVMAVLTPEQKARLQQLRTKWREERRGHDHRRRHGGWHHGDKTDDS
jgi:Spy/CpxP family protein refolding chaperone